MCSALFTRPTPDRSAAEFRQFLAELALNHPAAQTIHRVADNLNTYRKKSVVQHLGEVAGNHLGSRFTVPYTPQHGRWLNQAVISLFSRQCLANHRIPTLASLRAEAGAWNHQINHAQTKSIGNSAAKKHGAAWVTRSTFLSG
jgi:hypothetical protein